MLGEFLNVLDPVAFQERFWPQVKFYDKQWDVIYSVVDDDETVVPAGNKLGKDYVAGFICTYFFLSRHPCRIVTTSAKEEHLRVLWGEINNFIQTCAVPLDYKRGGPLVLNHQEVKKIHKNERCPISYMLGMVASQDAIAAMQGHHVAKTGDRVPRTLFVADECSSVPDEYYKMADTWANRKLLFGNPWPCANFFYRAVEGVPGGGEGGKDKGGDLPRPEGKRGYYRRVIHIAASDSPNVRFAEAQLRLGVQPTDEMVVPGVKPYDEYVRDRQVLPPNEQAVRLDGRFYKGREVLLYPAEWLGHAQLLAAEMERDGNCTRDAQGRLVKRKAVAIGVDPAEGGDSSAWTVVDEYGVLEQVSMKTPDTSVVPSHTIALMTKWGVPAGKVAFDRGGGGKEHADFMRTRGYGVLTVGFGEAVTDDPTRVTPSTRMRVDLKEERYSYLNRRAEMYGGLRELLRTDRERLVVPRTQALDAMNQRTGQPPSVYYPQGVPWRGFGIPARYQECIRQLSPIPLLFNEEGRLVMPPKNKREGSRLVRTPSLYELIGCSPDEADSLVLAVYAMTRRVAQFTAGAF